MKIKTPFHADLSCIAIAKVFDGNTILTLKIKLSRNYSVAAITNNYNTTYFMDHKKSLGIVDIMLFGYYNISHQTLSNNLSSIHEFQCLAKLCNQYKKDLNKINSANNDNFCKITETKELNNSNKNPNPWLAQDDPQRHMSDKEILDKSINLKDSDFTESEKKELMTILYKHKAAFSLCDEIGQCLIINIYIEVIDESPFFVRPFPISEKDKPIISLGNLSKNSTGSYFTSNANYSQTNKGQNTSCKI